MDCAHCGAPLVPGKPFCPGCGEPAEGACPHCGERVRADFRFCPSCGGAVAQGAPRTLPDATAAGPVPPALADRVRSRPSAAGERKRVTVLFCDLVGSTRIAERLDPEEYRDLLDRYLELAFAEVYGLDGIVNQLAGDGFMALFGAPIAHEDAPQRAVRAALAIRRALEELEDGAPAGPGPRLRARIGIHTGMVVVGNVGNDLKMDYTAIGDTTNLAARLQALAEPGAILVSAATYQLVRHHFEAKSRGALDVPGKRERVEAWEIAGLGEAATPMAIAEARGLTPLFGRDRELAQLAACFERAREGLPQLVSVIGDAGSGKSRLVYEFKRQLDETDATLLEARCSSLSQAVPGAPWRELLGQHFRLDAEDGPELACDKIARAVRTIDPELEEAYPLLCHFLHRPAERAELPAEALELRLFRAISRLLLLAAAEAPVVLVFEDLHWIDPLSRQLLEFAASRLDGERLMLLVTYREYYSPEWRTRAASTQLRLRPLLDPEIDGILRARAGGVLPAELERRLRERAEGNPFFAEELTRSLVQQSFLAPGNGHLVLTRPLAEVHIPDTVQELLGARLDRLRPGAKRVAQLAALVGRQFRGEDVEALLDGGGIDVGAELAELERHGVIHRKDAGDDYRFGESLTQEVAYESLLLKERRQLHARMAELLEGRGDPALVAHHLVRSDDRERAIAALLRAAAEAEALPSYGAAWELFQNAWSLAEAALDGGGDPERFQRDALAATLGLSRVSVIYGGPDGSDQRRPAERGRELAEQLGDRQALATLITLEGMVAMAGDEAQFAEGLALVERGLEIAAQDGLERLAISYRRGVAWGYMFDGRFEPANEMIDACIRDLERKGEAEGLSDGYLGSLHFQARILYHSDRRDEAAEAAARARELARSARNRTVTSATANTLALVAFDREEYEEARQLADEALAIGEEIGSASTIRVAAAIALGSRLSLHEPASTSRYLQQLEESLVDSGDMALHAPLLVEVLLAAGDATCAERVARLAEAQSGARLRRLNSALATAAVRQRRGAEHAASARAAYDCAIALAEELGASSGLARALIGAAELAGAGEEPAHAATLARRALAVARPLGLTRYVSQASRLLA